VPPSECEIGHWLECQGKRGMGLIEIGRIGLLKAAEPDF